MTLDAFAEKIKKSISEYLGDQTVLSIRKVTKNNGIVLCGLVFGGEGCSSAPTVYLEELHMAYEAGFTLGEIVRQICAVYEESRKRQFSMDFFQDYSKVKSRLSCRLVNYERNRELLQEIPHTRFLDLAVTYSCLILSETLGNASIVIRNEHIKLWGIECGQIHRDAMENMCRITPADIFPMDEMVEEHMRDSLRESVEPVMRDKNPDHEDTYYEEVLDSLCGFLMNCARRGKDAFPMFVLTNRQRNYGAASVLYIDMLRKYADILGHNLFILPSSVHEIIFFPDENPGTRMNIHQIVHEVNDSHVPAEEYLSDTVYYFDRTAEEIRIY